MDCGAACLASVAGYYGLKMPVARLRRLAGTDREGTSIYGLVKAAEKLGFTAKGMKGDPGALLSDIPLPAIAHVIKDGNILHFMVIYEISAERVTAADPARGIVKYSFQDFVSIWTGALIFIEPRQSRHCGQLRHSRPRQPRVPIIRQQAQKYSRTREKTDPAPFHALAPDNRRRHRSIVLLRAHHRHDRAVRQPRYAHPHHRRHHSPVPAEEPAFRNAPETADPHLRPHQRIPDDRLFQTRDPPADGLFQHPQDGRDHLEIQRRFEDPGSCLRAPC